MSDLILVPGQTNLTALEQIWRAGSPVKLAASAQAGILRSAKRIAEAARGDAPVYGVNTGFGKLASIKVPPRDTAALQRNLILSHCCGVGEPVEPETVRLIMVLKLLSLGRGASGVRPDLIRLMEAMLDRDVLPVIPSQGSVGASGDLAPLAHMAAVMIGEWRALHDGHEMTGRDALAAAGEYDDVPGQVVDETGRVVDGAALLPGQLGGGDRRGDAVVALGPPGEDEQVLPDRVGLPTLRRGQAEGELGAEDCREVVALRGLGETWRPVEAVVVGQREAAQPEPDRLLDQLARTARPVEEGEVRVGVQLGVGAGVLGAGDSGRSDVGLPLA